MNRLHLSACHPRFGLASAEDALELSFCALPPFESQAADDTPQLHAVRIGPQHLRIAMQDVEIGRSAARQPPHVAQPSAHGQTPAERHPVGVDDLKTIPVILFPVQDVPDIQILVLHAGPVHPNQKSGRAVEDVLRLLALHERLGRGTDRLVIRIQRHEITLLQQPAGPHLHDGNLLGRVDAQPAQPAGMRISAHGLALAQQAVGETIERREADVAFDDEPHAVRLEEFDDVAAAVQRLSVPGEEERTGQPFDERPQVFITRIDEDFHNLQRFNRWV